MPVTTLKSLTRDEKEEARKEFFKKLFKKPTFI
jgi:hypothetical protein